MGIFSQLFFKSINEEANKLLIQKTDEIKLKVLSDFRENLARMNCSIQSLKDEVTESRQEIKEVKETAKQQKTMLDTVLTVIQSKYPNEVNETLKAINAQKITSSNEEVFDQENQKSKTAKVRLGR